MAKSKGSSGLSSHLSKTELFYPHCSHTSHRGLALTQTNTCVDRSPPILQGRIILPYMELNTARKFNITGHGTCFFNSTFQALIQKLIRSIDSTDITQDTIILPWPEEISVSLMLITFWAAAFLTVTLNQYKSLRAVVTGLSKVWMEKYYWCKNYFLFCQR